MALKFNHPLLLLWTILVFVCLGSAVFSAALGGRKVLVGGWKGVDPKDPAVVENGKFAIDEHNKEAQTKLQFRSVVKAQQQVVSGVNYKLVIQATDGDASNEYEAIIWVKEWQKFKQLTSFKKID